MSEFVGQKKLLKTINSYTLQSLPHTILLLGEEGSGKKTIVKILSNKLSMPIVNIFDEVVKRWTPGKPPSRPEIITELLNDYTIRALHTIYVVDISYFDTENYQNQFLKFIEEPPAYAHIILINISEAGILPTIINRCQKLRTEPYKIGELKQIKKFDNELAYKVCKTPGQLNSIDEKTLTDMYNLCSTMVDKITITPYANMMSIAARINYKEDYNKFDFETFLNMLEYVSLDKFISGKNDIARKMYLYTIKRRQELIINTSVQKEPFMINLLDGLWKEVK